MQRDLAWILVLSAVLVLFEAALGVWRITQTRAGAAIGAEVVVDRLAWDVAW